MFQLQIFAVFHNGQFVKPTPSRLKCVPLTLVVSTTSSVALLVEQLISGDNGLFVHTSKLPIARTTADAIATKLCVVTLMAPTVLCSNNAALLYSENIGRGGFVFDLTVTDTINYPLALFSVIAPEIRNLDLTNWAKINNVRCMMCRVFGNDNPTMWGAALRVCLRQPLCAAVECTEPAGMYTPFCTTCECFRSCLGRV